MKLLRFKDNTFMWLSGKNDNSISEILPEKQAIAYGVWQLKIPRKEVILGMGNLKWFDDSTVAVKKDNVAIFGNDKRIFLYTTKQGEA